MPEDDYFHNDPNVYYTETNVGEDTETIAIGCTCSENSQCQNENESCQCIEMSGGILNYTSDGKVIVKENPIFECRPLCQCKNCSNRVVQNGPVSGLVVQDFGTKGLGLICQTPVSKGTVFEFIVFVCSYFQLMFCSSRFSFLVTFGDEVMKIRKYFTFCKARWARRKKKSGN